LEREREGWLPRVGSRGRLRTDSSFSKGVGTVDSSDVSRYDQFSSSSSCEKSGNGVRCCGVGAVIKLDEDGSEAGLRNGEDVDVVV